MTTQKSNKILPSSMLDKARVLKALGDETRLRIIGLLTHGELCVCDIMTVLNIPQSTVSRHLAYLKNTGWIDGKRKGKWMYYTLLEDGTEPKRDILEPLITSFGNDAMAQRDQLALELLRSEKILACQ